MILGSRFYFDHESPCMLCGERLVAKFPWFKDRVVELMCNHCNTKQEVYPHRKIIKEEKS